MRRRCRRARDRAADGKIQGQPQMGQGQAGPQMAQSQAGPQMAGSREPQMAQSQDGRRWRRLKQGREMAVRE